MCSASAQRRTGSDIRRCLLTDDEQGQSGWPCRLPRDLSSLSPSLWVSTWGSRSAGRGGVARYRFVDEIRIASNLAVSLGMRMLRIRAGRCLLLRVGRECRCTGVLGSVVLGHCDHYPRHWWRPSSARRLNPSKASLQNSWRAIAFAFRRWRSISWKTERQISSRQRALA